jgi:hypothetical protein
MQILLQAKSVAADFVVRFASDTLIRSVGKRNRSAAGPYAVKSGKRAGLGVTQRYRQRQRGGNDGNLDRLFKPAGAKQFHIEVPIQIDALGSETFRRIEDLVSPQWVRFKCRRFLLPQL